MKAKPVYTVRFGAVQAAVWKNDSENGPWFNVTISRTYKDGDVLKDSTSFGRDDLPLVAKAADMAHTWIYQQKKN